MNYCFFMQGKNYTFFPFRFQNPLMISRGGHVSLGGENQFRVKYNQSELHCNLF